MIVHQLQVTQTTEEGTTGECEFQDVGITRNHYAAHLELIYIVCQLVFKKKIKKKLMAGVRTACVGERRVGKAQMHQAS